MSAILYSHSVQIQGEAIMASETTCTQARANFAALCDEVTSTREPVVIHRRGQEDVALVSAAELRSLLETAHLLRSAKNAQRLLTALVRARREDLPAESVDALRQGFDLGQEP
jgi:antitoxin YefM